MQRGGGCYGGGTLGQCQRVLGPGAACLGLSLLAIRGTLYVALNPHRDMYVEGCALDDPRIWKLGLRGGLVGRDRHQLSDRRLVRLPWEEISGEVVEMGCESDETRCTYLREHAPVGPALPAQLVPLGHAPVGQHTSGGEVPPVSYIAVALADSFTPPDDQHADEEDDIWTLLVHYNTAGVLTRTFDADTLLRTGNAMAGWRVPGPRTARWLYSAFTERPSTPGRRHQWWTHCLGLGPSDERVAEHPLLGEVLELALQQDQLDVPEGACFESIARRHQGWEQLYDSELRDRTDAGGGGSNMDRDERALFLAQTRPTNSVLVAPALKEWVTAQLKEKSSTLEERREARGEQHDTSKDGGGKGGKRRRKGKKGEDPPP